MTNRAVQDRPVPVDRGASKTPHDPVNRDGSVFSSYRGFRVKIMGADGCYCGVICQDHGEKGLPMIVVHPNGDHFKHRQSAITTVKTVIKWHLKFGGWRMPK